MVPFRADHIGSLLRPKRLREAFRQLSGSALRAVQDECIREVVRLQADCGLEVVTDGEFRRISYWEKFVRLTKGLEVKDAVFTFHDAEGHESKFTAPYVSGKVGRQMQSWVRMPEGWRIAAAHVSIIDEPAQDRQGD